MNRAEAKDILNYDIRQYIKQCEDATDEDFEALDLAIEALQEPKSEQYKKGFEDAKRAFLIEYARESENMRKRNAELEVMLNVQKAISAEAVQGDAETATATDCISRKQAINAVENTDIKITESEWDELINAIDNLPPVNQKQITGKLENAENATSEGEESTMSQPKSKLDCISRQQAIEVLAHVKEDEQWRTECIDNEIRLIESLSPVTPTERTGEWKIWNEPGNECVYCTKCKHEYDQIDLYIGGSEYPNYCPNCGADMRGDTENE